MATEEYSTLLRTRELVPHHQRKFTVILRTRLKFLKQCPTTYHYHVTDHHFFKWHINLLGTSRGPISISQLPGWTLTLQHHGRIQLLNTMIGTQHLNTMVGPNFSTPWPELNCIFFKIFQIFIPSLLGITSSTLKPHFLSGVYYDNGNCHILCARA